MEITSKNYPVTITDERSESSYHIPVVVYNGIAYGDADVIVDHGEEGDLEHSVWTGRQAKYDIARREYADDQKTFDWIVKGTGLKRHADYMAEIDAGRKQIAWMFED